MEYISSWKERITTWLRENAETREARALLALCSFFEATIVPLPPSTLLLALIALGRKHQWIFLATFTTIFSVLGGLFGYVIGFALYDTLGVWLVETYHLSDEIAHVGTLFAENAFWAVFVGAFTPVPYKAFTIGGGFFSINLLSFITASFLGRGIRFYAIGFLGYLFGEHVARRLFFYVGLASVAAVVLLVLLVVV